MTEQEKALAEAIAERDKIKATRDEAAAAIELAKSVAAAADRVMDEHNEAQEQSSSSHAELLQQWIEGGCNGDAPENPDEKRLAGLRAAAMKAEANRTAANKAIALVEHRFLASSEALRDAEREVGFAVDHLIAVETDRMAEELVACEARALELRQRLVAVPRPQFHDQAGYARLSSRTVAVIGTPPAPWRPDALATENPYRQVTARYAEEWSSRIRDLTENGASQTEDAM